MAIDLGALAKGYIADKIVEHLKRMGVTAGLINLGGNVLSFGQAPTMQMVSGGLASSTPKNLAATMSWLSKSGKNRL